LEEWKVFIVRSVLVLGPEAQSPVTFRFWSTSAAAGRVTPAAIADHSVKSPDIRASLRWYDERLLQMPQISIR
jgi:hypothetical protein